MNQNGGTEKILKLYESCASCVSKMKFLRSGLLFFLSFETLWIVANGVVQFTPGCLDSCSDQVNCTISHSIHACGMGASSNKSQGPDIAAEPVHLNVTKTLIGDFRYINITWKPPEDGSYNYLEKFLVQVTEINLDPRADAGLKGTYCYNVIPSPDWFTKHRSIHHFGGVKFFMNCLRVPIQASVELVISIHSLPLKPNAPKLTTTRVNIEPEFWNPGFVKWADTENVMHLIIKNPLKEAMYYLVKIKSIAKDDMVFSHFFSADTDNKTHDGFHQFSEDRLPHFLIRGLDRTDNYSIWMEVLDGNKSGLSHMPIIQTHPFRLNFTDIPLPVSLPTHHLDNRLIIVVSVVLVAIVGVFVCLVWKGIVHPRKLRALLGNCVAQLHGRDLRSVSFLPIYCYENDNYIGAVENHVTLLQCCLEKHGGLTNAQATIPLCCFNTTNQSGTDPKASEQNVIIYLSPRLGEILKFGETYPEQISKYDVSCHKSLLKLAECNRQGKVVVPIVVTFDCFDQGEISFIEDLFAFVVAPESGVGFESFLPLRLATFTSNGWKVENLDRLFMRLNPLQDSSQTTPLSLQGWSESEKAQAVERHLSLLADYQAQRPGEIIISWNQKGYSNSRNLSSMYYSRKINCSQDELDTAISDRLGRGQVDHEIRRSHGDVTLSPSEFLHGSCSTRSENFLNSMLPSHYLKSSTISYDKLKLSPTARLSSENLKFPPSYGYNPIKSHGQNHQYNKEVVEPIKDERTNIHPKDLPSHNYVLYTETIDTRDSVSVNSVDSDSLIRPKDCNGYIKGRGQNLSDVPQKREWENRKSLFKTIVTKDIIPPCLNHSNFTSLDSVCERINRVNDYSGWDEIHQF